jgi:hypothetical protein
MMKGTPDKLASDLISGKIKIIEAVASPDTKKLALLSKKHDDQCAIHNRAATEAHTLHKYHKERGEHELSKIHKELVDPLKSAATLHKKLAGLYSKRHGGEAK